MMMDDGDGDDDGDTAIRLFRFTCPGLVFPGQVFRFWFSDSGSPALVFCFLSGSGVSDSFLHFRFSGFGFPVQLPGSGLRFWLFRFRCLGLEIWQ